MGEEEAENAQYVVQPWYHSKLMRKYPERWIAIVGKKVGGVGKSMSEAEKNTIIVRDGTYSETVDVNMRLTIRSKDRTDDYLFIWYDSIILYK